jgi:hypothetical protein
LTSLGWARDLPDGGGYYACPCCLQPFTRAAAETGVLTLEDVPPKELGGKPMLLTCKNCNNRAGHSFDAHAVTRARSDDFARGRAGGDLPVTAYADGIPLRGTATWTEEGLRIVGVDKQNDDRELAKHIEALAGFANLRDRQPNFSFTVRTRFDEPRARYSWIRSAYLAAFAGLGWTYILRHALRPVRAQLANPEAEVLPTYVFRDPEGVATSRRILVVTEPSELRCVAVMIGEHGVFLPGLSDPLTMDELGRAFTQRCREDGRLTVRLQGKLVPWPSRATYLMDG